VTTPDSRSHQERRSVSELFGELTQDLALLVRQETQLAKTEMQTKLSRLTQDLVSLAAGGMVLLIGALALTAALILLLVHPVGLAPWLAALVVGVAFAGLGGLLLRRGLGDLKRIDPTPRRTVESIKEDIQMAREVRQ
jgi:Putative Actinobacterial Holin-X, holin superfamily III